MFKRPVIVIVIVLILFVTAGSLLLLYTRPARTAPSRQPLANDFVGEQSCKSCHSREYNDWQQSHHFMAMQPANDSTVLGDFNQKTITADGITSTFFKKNGKFFINTEGEDGTSRDYEVKYIFGFTPLQQYLVEFPGGRMQVPRVSWDSKTKKWFHQYPGHTIHSRDWLHWTGNAQNWNTMCASCHSTNLRKNYNPDTEIYNTTYSSINVSCESCHGPGKHHISYVNSDEYKIGKKGTGSYLQLAKNAEQLHQINACATCHALKSDISANRIQSTEFLDNHIPEIPNVEHFHPDGQVKDESYIYTSFLQSKMFHRDVKCSNCHQPHSGKLVLPGNQLCGQCHSKSYDNPAHSFHPAGSAASDCKSCHMPGKTFMGNDFRHDHSFRVPRPDLSVKYGTPNACNACHTNKSAQWASTAITKWYGPVRKYHFAEDLLPGSRVDKESEKHLLKLISDTSVPKIVQATATHYLGNIGTQASGQTLIRSLADSNAQVRYTAVRSLSNFPENTWLPAIGPLLSDKVRAVRIAAADLLLTVPAQQLPAEYAKAFSAARNELQDYLQYQLDFAAGNLLMGDHYLRLRDYYNAEKYYVRGLKKDSLMNLARLNLSTVYNLQGKNDQALKVLETAATIDPKNDRIWYNMALLFNEMNDRTKSANAFAKAVALKTQNPRVYYNYGLLLKETGKIKEAESVLLKGIAINNTAADLYYALTFVYIEAKDLSKARQTAIRLKQLAPNNPQYLELYRNLGV